MHSQLKIREGINKLLQGSKMIYKEIFDQIKKKKVQETY